MAVRDELGLVVAVALLLQVHVQHAHGDAGQGDHEAQDLPRLGCERDNEEDQFDKLLNPTTARKNSLEHEGDASRVLKSRRISQGTLGDSFLAQIFYLVL